MWEFEFEFACHWDLTGDRKRKHPGMCAGPAEKARLVVVVVAARFAVKPRVWVVESKDWIVRSLCVSLGIRAMFCTQVAKYVRQKWHQETKTDPRGTRTSRLQ